MSVFKIFRYPEKVQIQNVWVEKNLNLPKYEINPDLRHELIPDHLKNKFSHLKNIDFYLSDEVNVSIFIGKNIPKLNICYDVIQGSKNQLHY